jgi:hypothetical protein
MKNAPAKKRWLIGWALLIAAGGAAGETALPTPISLPAQATILLAQAGRVATARCLVAHKTGLHATNPEMRATYLRIAALQCAQAAIDMAAVQQNEAALEPSATAIALSTSAPPSITLSAGSVPPPIPSPSQTPDLRQVPRGEAVGAGYVQAEAMPSSLTASLPVAAATPTWAAATAEKFQRLAEQTSGMEPVADPQVPGSIGMPEFPGGPGGERAADTDSRFDEAPRAPVAAQVGAPPMTLFAYAKLRLRKLTLKGNRAPAAGSIARDKSFSAPGLGEKTL